MKNCTVFYILTLFLLTLIHLSICSVETTAASSSITSKLTLETTKVVGKNREIRDNSNGIKRITKNLKNEKKAEGNKE